MAFCEASRPGRDPRDGKRRGAELRGLQDVRPAPDPSTTWNTESKRDLEAPGERYYTHRSTKVPDHNRLWSVTVCDLERIPHEGGSEIAASLERVFRRFGPPAELVLDNGTGFRSRQVADVCAKWKVQRWFRAAYRPEGNSIVERHHGTVKRMLVRGDKPVEDVVHIYNMMPRGKRWKAPAELLFRRRWRNRFLDAPAGLEKRNETFSGEKPLRDRARKCT